MASQLFGYDAAVDRLETPHNDSIGDSTSKISPKIEHETIVSNGTPEFVRTREKAEQKARERRAATCALVKSQVYEERSTEQVGAALEQDADGNRGQWPAPLEMSLMSSRATLAAVQGQSFPSISPGIGEPSSPGSPLSPHSSGDDHNSRNPKKKLKRSKSKTWKFDKNR